MFVRKKKNRTGTISVVVVDKSKGSFKEVKNFGVVSSEVEAYVLCEEAHEWINTYGGQQILDFGKTDAQERELEETARVFANIDSVLFPKSGPHPCLTRIFCPRVHNPTHRILRPLSIIYNHTSQVNN